MGEDATEYDFDEIIGLTVETTAGQILGRVSRVISTGANDVYFVRRDDGSEVLLPAIRQVIKDIDLDAGKMTVDPLPGLLEL